jgi:NADH:ubiquinone oxidoreductase subunit 6 (subunit J)
MKKFYETLKEVLKLIIQDKFLITVMILLAFTIPMLLKDDKALSNIENLFKNQNLNIFFVIIITTLTIIPFVIRFLYEDKEKKKPFDKYLNDLQNIREFKRQEELVRDTINRMLNNNPDLASLEKSIYKKIEEDFENAILKKLEEKFKEDSETKVLTDTILGELNPLIYNTEKYIDRIQRNSIVNLVIGIVGTIIAISILAFSILSDKTYSDLEDFTIHLLPRITFVIFIQLFAFFFLRLYKNNLEDGKYFQNELTNLSSKCSALKIAILTKNTDKQSEILTQLSLVERNFKIQKEETLLNIEKAKIEKEYDLELLNAFKDYFKTSKKE